LRDIFVIGILDIGFGLAAAALSDSPLLPAFVAAGGPPILLFLAILLGVFQEGEPSEAEQVIALSGLRRVFPVRTFNIDGSALDYRDEERIAAEASIAELVPSYRRLSVMLASGFHHIGNRESASLGALGEALDSLEDCELEVLLLNPHCDAAFRRGSELRPDLVEDDWYVTGICHVIQQLRQWAQRPGWTINLMLYDELPIWEMVVLGSDTLFLMCSSPDVPSDKSPVYEFDLGSRWGLGWGLLQVLQRRRGGATEAAVDDDRFEPSGPPMDFRRLG
jgi:hypothetical protein